MGCCCSSSSVEETKPLLHDEPSLASRSSYSNAIRPSCKCGKKMNYYELQCCYINNETGDPFEGTINCETCGKAMNNSHEIVWHCLQKHDYSYDLCFECGTQIALESKEESKVDTQDKFPIKFDPKYNTENINWNELYSTFCELAKGWKVKRIIEQNLDLNNLDQYNFPNDIINFINKILANVQMTQNVHNACTENSGWITQADQDDITISYKREENTLFHSIRSNFLCKCSVLDFIATLNEFDLLGDLIKIVPVKSTMLKEFTNSDKVIYMDIALWWPMKNRDFIIHVNACDALEEEIEEVVLWGSSPKHDKIENVNIPSEEECNTTRVDIIRLDVVCKPLRFGKKNEKDLTRVIMIFNVDFKSYMPIKLVNWVSRTFSYALVKVIRDRCENLKGTEHEKRIHSKEIYRKWRLSLMEWQKNKVQKENEQSNDVGTDE